MSHTQTDPVRCYCACSKVGTPLQRSISLPLGWQCKSNRSMIGRAEGHHRVVKGLILATNSLLHRLQAVP